MANDEGAPKRAGRGTNRDSAFDVALGARIRTARVAMGMKQATLGEAIGVSYQQVQKYEWGKDRVTASALAALAAALCVHPGSFFDDGMPAAHMGATPTPQNTLAKLSDAQRIGERIGRLCDPVVIRRLVSLVDALGSGLNQAVALEI